MLEPGQGSAAPAARAVLDSGWLLVRRSSDGAVGFAPSNYLEAI